MFYYLKQKSKNKCLKNHIKRCNKKHNKKTKTLQWQQYQRLYKIHNIPAWQLSHKKQQQQQKQKQQQKEYLRNLKCDKLQIEIRIYKEFYKKEASHEHINVKSLNDIFNTNINTTNDNNNNNNNKHQKYANLLWKNSIINYNKQQQELQRFITRHEQQTETDDIELQEEGKEEEKASWEIFNHNRNTRVENSLQNIIFMLKTYQKILINFNKIDYKYNNNNNNNLKFHNNNYNYKYILKNQPKAINKTAEILMSNQHKYIKNNEIKNNNNLKTGTARSSFNNLQSNEIIVGQAKFKTKEITIPATPPNEIVTVTGNMQETETICKEINITTIVNSNIKQHSHPTKEQHDKMKEEEEEEVEEKVIKTVENVKPSHYQQIEHYIHEYQIQKHLRRQNQQQQQEDLSEKPASANKHNTNHYNNNKNNNNNNNSNNNNMIKNHLNNEKKSIINTNGFRLILLALFVIYTCPCGNASRLANGGMSKSPSANKEQLNIGLIAPHTNFGKREYLRAINTAVSGLTKTRGAKLTFLENYSFQPRNIHFDMMSLTPSPTGKL